MHKKIIQVTTNIVVFTDSLDYQLIGPGFDSCAAFLFINLTYPKFKCFAHIAPEHSRFRSYFPLFSIHLQDSKRKNLEKFISERLVKISKFMETPGKKRLLIIQKTANLYDVSQYFFKKVIKRWGSKLSTPIFHDVSKSFPNANYKTFNILWKSDGIEIVTDKNRSHKILFSQLKSNVIVDSKKLLNIEIPKRINEIKIPFFKGFSYICSFLFYNDHRPDIVVNTIIAIFKSSNDVKRLFPEWQSFCNVIFFNSRVIKAIKNEDRCLDLISKNMNYIFSLGPKEKIIAEFKRYGLWNEIEKRLKNKK